MLVEVESDGLLYNGDFSFLESIVNTTSSLPFELLEVEFVVVIIGIALVSICWVLLVASQMTVGVGVDIAVDVGVVTFLLPVVIHSATSYFCFLLFLIVIVLWLRTH